MDGFSAVDFALAREVLQRGIATLYLVAFASSLAQFRALLGERGLLPATELLEWARSSDRAARLLRPTLFRWVGYSDRRLVALCVGGIAVSALLVAGVPQLGPPWLPMVAFLALWLGYMSIVSIGQTFYGFGWEMLLLEAGFLAAFLGSQGQPPPVHVLVLFWWLVFRLEFGAGMIKLRGGREWRDLTALTYHHETQPMPGPLSRRAHLLPRWVHKGEVLGNHVAQLVVPWFLFAPLLGLWVPDVVPQAVGAVSAGIIVLSQLWLVATGNFAWLNWATIVLATSAIAVPAARGPVGDIPAYWLAITLAVTALYAVLSWWPARNLAARDQLMNASFNRWNLANAYGAFGTVTKERIEWVVEGTLGDDPLRAEWRAYGFRGKPGEVHRTPGQFAPYHLRLDWLMWFLPLRPTSSWGRLEDWFRAFLVRLLEADRATLRLLRADPFEGERPRWVRVVSYRYRFATDAERRALAETGGRGVVWLRDRRRVVLDPIALTREG
ncbi:lipase maturation factor family protein [Microbacterium marinilacus]|uniref:Lipase maturation factor family protein n=1 Tax=Microbacterium marinilacus TaxID=415209 RepID=A0ABP7BGM7_9MICO|nr:lipase maturation factor family protein [Microbacterium marinilacus]MBY0689644.1 lipase maturation factor family protein [Microbacterium marinilacus]